MRSRHDPVGQGFAIPRSYFYLILAKRPRSDKGKRGLHSAVHMNTCTVVQYDEI